MSFNCSEGSWVSVTQKGKILDYCLASFSDFFSDFLCLSAKQSEKICTERDAHQKPNPQRVYLIRGKQAGSQEHFRGSNKENG